MRISDWSSDVCSSDLAVGTVNVYATERVKFSALSGEVRALTTFDSPINLLLGAYYQSTKRNFNQYAFTGNLENSAAADPKDRFVAFSKDSATKGETLSVYGQATWKILSNFELTGGVRYIYEKIGRASCRERVCRSG